MEKEIRGTIFDIQRFCLNDGPGIRTTLFFKGCPLRCKWCHNPESWEKRAQLFYRKEKCVGCGECVKACRSGIHRIDANGHTAELSRCEACGYCLDVCCYGALEMSGRQLTVSQAFQEIEPDISYYKEAGGVTFSGGEPMMQPEFAVCLARALARESISLCVETSGYAAANYFRDIAPYVELFLFDFKVTDEKRHRNLTGVSNSLIIENLSFLNSIEKKVILRCPMIPDVNDSTEDLRAIAEMYHRFPSVEAVELMPYHTMGEAKKMQLGQDNSLFAVDTPTEENKKRWVDALLEMGCIAKLG